LTAMGKSALMPLLKPATVTFPPAGPDAIVWLRSAKEQSNEIDSNVFYDDGELTRGRGLGGPGLCAGRTVNREP
jgi:hypothetical protein